MSAAKASATALPVDDKRHANESTMEEILASIRRIITEDQNARQTDRQPDDFSEPEAAVDPEPSMERLLGSIAEPVSAPDFRVEEGLAGRDRTEDRRDNFLRHLRASSEAQSRGAFRQAAEILEAAERELTGFDPQAANNCAAPVNALAEESLSPLVSDRTAATIAAQFETLAASRLFGDDGRMDEMVKELLRPMLRDWLDDNLPGIVEKLVRAEIERVSRGGRN